MSLTTADVAVAGGAAFVVLVVLFLVWRSRRALTRRLTAVVTRLERPGADVSSGRGLEGMLHRLEKAADNLGLEIAENAFGSRVPTELITVKSQEEYSVLLGIRGQQVESLSHFLRRKQR